MDTESATVNGHDVTTIICVCGNAVGKEGLIPANSDGVPIHPGPDVPAGLARWPDDGELFTLCPSCGRVYSDSVVEETGKAPVAFRVNIESGPIAEAIRLHWNES